MTPDQALFLAALGLLLITGSLFAVWIGGLPRDDD